MSESMVDRVARAIGEKVAPALQPGGEPVRVKDVARAVIEAMREPTTFMAEGEHTRDLYFESGDTYSCWTKMIDAALKEDQ